MFLKGYLLFNMAGNGSRLAAVWEFEKQMLNNLKMFI